MAEIRLEALAKRFKGTNAVDGVDLTIADGEFFVLLGPSGSGKTTLLRLVAGLEDPDDGSIAIGDQALKLLTPTDFEVGPGDELWLRPDLERAGWFDPGSGARLD